VHRQLGGQAQVAQNLRDRRRVHDGREQAQPAAAGQTSTSMAKVRRSKSAQG
jgi:hypothetical protein